MSDCFYITDEKPAGNAETYVGKIDGNKATSKQDFLREIAKAFQFPEYFGENYDALEECLNDLGWIGLPHYIVYIKNYPAFLKNETHQKKLDTLALFCNVCNEWFDAEYDLREQPTFKVYIERCVEIESDLKSLSPI